MKPGERYEGTDRTGRTAQVFIRNCESGEPAYYCGPAKDNPALSLALGHVARDALEGALSADDDDTELCLEIWWMTPEEVAAIPAI